MPHVPGYDIINILFSPSGTDRGAAFLPCRGVQDMENQFSRSIIVFGEDAQRKLSGRRVAVFGIGGVGGYAVEALARGGVGAIDLVDNDVVVLSNLNRQIIATHDTIGRSKVRVAEERVRSINPDCRVTAHQVFFLPENAGMFDFSQYDYVIDAIDTVAGKLALIEACKSAGTPIICAMGAGNKTDPTAFAVADISQTKGDPLARVIRTECRKRELRGVKVVYSTETPVRSADEADHAATTEETTSKRRSIPGSVSFVPPVMGMILAGEVIKDLIGMKDTRLSSLKSV